MLPRLEPANLVLNTKYFKFQKKEADKRMWAITLNLSSDTNSLHRQQDDSREATVHE